MTRRRPTQCPTLRILTLALASLTLLTAGSPAARAGLTAAQQAKANAALLGLWEDVTDGSGSMSHEPITVAQVKSKLDIGADVNARDLHRMTPLIWAARTDGNAPVTKLLLLTCAAVNAIDRDGISPLARNVNTKSAVCAKLLVARGADVNSTDIEGDTVLMSAASGGNSAAVRLLLINGAEINAHSNNGYTALICAASGGYADCVKDLIAAGANVNAETVYGSTAISIAAPFPAVAALLANAGARVPPHRVRADITSGVAFGPDIVDPDTFLGRRRRLMH